MRVRAQGRALGGARAGAAQNVTGLRRALALVAILLSSDHAEARGLSAVLGLFLGWSFIGAGLYAWWRRPDNRFGVLMTAVGFAFFLGSLSAADGSWLFTIGILLSSVYLPVCGYVISVLGPVPTLLFADLEQEGCVDCPPSAISLGTHDTLFTVSDVLLSVVAVALVGYVLYVLVQRWQA